MENTTIFPNYYFINLKVPTFNINATYTKTHLKLWLQDCFSIYAHFSLASTIATKLSNLVGIAVVFRILRMKSCVFMRRSYFVRKSRFVVTKQTWTKEKIMTTDHKSVIYPVLQKIASILSKKAPYSLKPFFKYKQREIKGLCNI